MKPHPTPGLRVDEQGVHIDCFRATTQYRWDATHCFVYIGGPNDHVELSRLNQWVEHSLRCRFRDRCTIVVVPGNVR